MYDEEEGEWGSDDYKEDCQSMQEASHQPPDHNYSRTLMFFALKLLQ